MPFAGTLSIGHPTYLDHVLDILGSVQGHGFTNLVMFNAHGGNQAVGTVALERFGYRHPNARVIFTSWWQVAGPELLALSTSGPGGVGHACELETSMMLEAASELVDVAAAPQRSGSSPYPWAASDMLRSSRARLYRRQDQISPDGVFGDPGLATAAKGREAIDLIAGQMVALLGTLR